MYDMGALATKKLMKRMKNREAEPEHKVFAPELILRSSTEKEIKEES
jgi:DNA-binding LacI/PurR family transcriptional regulator